MRKTILASVAATLLAVGVIGVVGAQSAPNSGGKSYLEVLAGKLGVTPEKLQSAMKEAREETRPQRGESIRVEIKDHFAVAARTIGISEDDLRKELREGKSIAEVAQARNVDPKRVTDALIADLNTTIDKAVTDGKLTAERATQMKERVAKAVEQLVSAKRPAPGARPDRPALPGLPGLPGVGRGGDRLITPFPFFPLIGGSLETAAKAIGITPEQLRQELPGKTLADVARAHNVNPTVVADALKAERKAAVDKMVDDLMNQRVPAAGERPRRPGSTNATPTIRPVLQRA
jgi:hypothetical protein